MSGGSYADLRSAAVSFIREHAQHSEVLILAPTRAAADELARAACVNQAAGLHRRTLPELAAELSRRKLAEAGRVAVTQLVTEALATRTVSLVKDNLTYFGPVASTPGFPAALLRTLRDLRLNCVDTEILPHDLKLLAKTYAGELATHGLADYADHLDAARVPARMPVLLLDIVARNQCEDAFLEAFLASAPATLRLTLSPEPAKPRGADGCFELFSASTEALEAVEIARRVRDAAAQGVAFDRIAVLLRNPARYQPVVEEAFRRAGIPAYYTQTSRRPDPRGRAVLTLLKCADEDLSASRFAEYLSIGMTPEDIGTPAAWEKLLVDAAVLGGKDRWDRRLQGLVMESLDRYNSADEEERPRYRKQIQAIEDLRAFALPLIDRLASLPRVASWGDWLQLIGEVASASLDQADYVLEMLEELQPMSAISGVDFASVLLTLEPHLLFLRPASRAPRYGKTFVGSIEDGRGMAFHTVLVPGLNEGIFPPPLFEDPLLLDGQKQKLGMEPEQREETERELLRIAAACAEERLVLSCSRIDLLTGRERVPSLYAFDAARAAGLSLSVRGFTKETGAAVETRIGWPAPRNPQDAIDDAEFDLATVRRAASAAYLLHVNEHLARSLRSRWRRWSAPWRAPDGLVDLDAHALAVLEHHRLDRRPHSASALQQYAVCPYRFALRAIFGLHPAEAAAPIQQMNPVLRGEIYHRAQFEVMGRLRARNGLPLDRSALPDALVLLDETLRELDRLYSERLAPAIPHVWRTEMEEIRTDLAGWLRYIATHEPDWVPALFEFSFGLEDIAGHDARSTIDPARLPSGVLLQGSIDCVERHTSGMLRIVDHKTGKPPKEAVEYTGKGETLQPLLYAMAAESVLADKVVSGRLFYSTLRQNYKVIDVNINQEGRRRAESILQSIDQAIHKGFLPAAPREEACRTCDYQSVCGPYEEDRVKLKSQVELRELKQIRSLS